MPNAVEFQRELTRQALNAAGTESKFVLAGSGALREHGLIDRPTDDVDLFTVAEAIQSFPGHVERVVGGLRSAGYEVAEERRTDAFARLSVVQQGLVMEIDLCVDWRNDSPVVLDIGPVLSLDDAVANKVAALFSRGEARDYLDVDRIRESKRFSDADLLRLGHRSDEGFDDDYFAERLKQVDDLEPSQVSAYGVREKQLELIATRLNHWANEIEAGAERCVASAACQTEPALAGQVWVRPHMRNGRAVEGHFRSRPSR